IYQLVWLLTNRDLRHVYESIAFTWLQEQTLKFEWTFTQPITVTAQIKEDQNTWPVTQIVNANNKYIPYENISISHPAMRDIPMSDPEIRDNETSMEAKKYTYRSLNKKDGEGGFTLDEQVDGATEDFDFVQMNQLGHEYTSVPKVKQVKLGSTKQRLEEDENTKRYYGDDHYIRST